MLAWGHSGFSAHNEVRVAPEDAEGRKQLAGTMLRAPMSLEKMSYDAATGTVIYRSKMHDKLLTVPAKCCKPAPPDAIIGFVTRGRGVTVHRATCANVKRLDPARRVTAEWGRAEGASFAVDIEVEALDRTGLLRDISEVLSRESLNVTCIHHVAAAK